MLLELFNKSHSSNNIDQDGSVSGSTFSTLINGNLPESINDPLSETSNEHSLTLRGNNYVRSEIVQEIENDTLTLALIMSVGIINNSDISSDNECRDNQ